MYHPLLMPCNAPNVGEVRRNLGDYVEIKECGHARLINPRCRKRGTIVEGGW
jgi:hypothetical protein